MIQEIEQIKSPAKVPASEGTWIQVTFTLDPEHYRTLWQRAEEEHRTLPGLIRDSVIGFLNGSKVVSRKRESGFLNIMRGRP